MLAIHNFSKAFNGRQILSSFSLSLPRNTFTVIVGPSGCGKSTLFNLLMGALPKDEGSLFLDGAEIPDLRSHAGYMAQKDLLLPWLPLLENALLPVTVRRAASPKDIREAKDLFQTLGLAGFEKHYPWQISGGMAQRCALARTLFFRAPLALLDEPFSSVDAITRQSLRNLLLLLQSRFDKTILMVTHDVDDALLLADRIVLLSSSPLSIKENLILNEKKPRNPTERNFSVLKAHVMTTLQEDLS